MALFSEMDKGLKVSHIFTTYDMNEYCMIYFHQPAHTHLNNIRLRSKSFLFTWKRNSSTAENCVTHLFLILSQTSCWFFAMLQHKDDWRYPLMCWRVWVLITSLWNKMNLTSSKNALLWVKKMISHLSMSKWDLFWFWMTSDLRVEESQV